MNLTPKHVFDVENMKTSCRMSSDCWSSDLGPSTHDAVGLVVFSLHTLHRFYCVVEDIDIVFPDLRN